MSEDIPGCHNRDGGNATDTRDAANILRGTGQTPTTKTDPAPNVHDPEWRKPALHTHISCDHCQASFLAFAVRPAHTVVAGWVAHLREGGSVRDVFLGRSLDSIPALHAHAEAS